MANWFHKNFGDDIWAAQPLSELEASFFQFQKINKTTDDMAIYYRHESGNGLHCEVVGYFSPALAGFAKSQQALPCPKPTQDNLRLLAGSELAWLQLFSNNDS